MHAALGTSVQAYIYCRWMWKGVCFWQRYVETASAVLDHQNYYAHATLSVLRHASSVIAVYILFYRINKYLLYRFKVTESLSFLQYSPPSHGLEALYTMLFVWVYLLRRFDSNQLLVWYKCNVGQSRKNILITRPHFFVLLKLRLTPATLKFQDTYFVWDHLWM